jgi:hypothetical protein
VFLGLAFNIYCYEYHKWNIQDCQRQKW